MDVNGAKRIVALSRQIGSYLAMVRKGDLLPAEAESLIAECHAEIGRIRAQGSLPLESPAVDQPKAVAPSAGAKGRS